MNDAFKKALAALGNFTEQEEQLLFQSIVERVLGKNETFLSIGQVSSEFAFVIKGSMRAYSLNQDQEEVTTGFFLPNDWALNYNSFSGRTPSTLNIVAYEECLLYTINMDTIHALIASSQSFLQLGRLLSPGHNGHIPVSSSQTPQENYEFLMANRPKLIQTFPLKWIASYLHITPETLSRVRAKIAHS